MMRLMIAAPVAVLLFLARSAEAGWVVEYSNIAVKPRGDRQPAVQSTTRIASGKMRADQDAIVMITDFSGDKFTVMNKEKQVFWTGTTSEYQKQMTGRKLEKLGKRFDSFKGKTELPPVDEEKLPRIVIRKTEQTRQIAGHKATKYTVESNGELFQELWVTDEVDISGDVNAEQQLAHQRKMNAGMIGKTAGPFNALHRSEDYKKLIEKSFILESVTHHGAGKFERTVTALRQADVSADEFKVPENYKRVRLADVFPAPKEKEEARAQGR